MCINFNDIMQAVVPADRSFNLPFSFSVWQFSLCSESPFKGLDFILYSAAYHYKFTCIHVSTITYPTGVSDVHLLAFCFLAGGAVLPLFTTDCAVTVVCPLIHLC